MSQPIFRIALTTKLFLITYFLVWIVSTFLVSDPNIVIASFGFVPAEFLNKLYTLITYQFLHGGILHLLMNSAMFAALGNAIESALTPLYYGKLRFALFVLLCGVIAVLGEWLLHPQSQSVFVGASGCVSGLLGALLFLDYRNKKSRRVFIQQIVVLTFVMAVIGYFNIPDTGNPVAWIAHIAGFLGGITLWPLVSRFRRI